MQASYTYELRLRGEILSTGTLTLERAPTPGETISLGPTTGTIKQIIALASETRLVVEVIDA